MRVVFCESLGLSRFRVLRLSRFRNSTGKIKGSSLVLIMVGGHSDAVLNQPKAVDVRLLVVHRLQCRGSRLPVAPNPTFVAVTCRVLPPDIQPSFP